MGLFKRAINAIKDYGHTQGNMVQKAGSKTKTSILSSGHRHTSSVLGTSKVTVRRK